MCITTKTFVCSYMLTLEHQTPNVKIESFVKLANY